MARNCYTTFLDPLANEIAEEKPQERIRDTWRVKLTWSWMGERCCWAAKLTSFSFRLILSETICSSAAAKWFIFRLFLLPFLSPSPTNWGFQGLGFMSRSNPKSVPWVIDWTPRNASSRSIYHSNPLTKAQILYAYYICRCFAWATNLHESSSYN